MKSMECVIIANKLLHQKVNKTIQQNLVYCSSICNLSFSLSSYLLLCCRQKTPLILKLYCCSSNTSSITIIHLFGHSDFIRFFLEDQVIFRYEKNNYTIKRFTPSSNWKTLAYFWYQNYKYQENSSIFRLKQQITVYNTLLLTSVVLNSLINHKRLKS